MLFRHSSAATWMAARADVVGGWGEGPPVRGGKERVVGWIRERREGRKGGRFMVAGGEVVAASSSSMSVSSSSIASSTKSYQQSVASRRGK